MKTTFIEYTKGFIATLVAISVAFIFNMTLVEKSITINTAFQMSLLFFISGWILVVVLSRISKF